MAVEAGVTPEPTPVGQIPVAPSVEPKPTPPPVDPPPPECELAALKRRVARLELLAGVADDATWDDVDEAEADAMTGTTGAERLAARAKRDTTIGRGAPNDGNR